MSFFGEDSKLNLEKVETTIYQCAFRYGWSICGEITFDDGDDCTIITFGNEIIANDCPN